MLLLQKVRLVERLLCEVGVWVVLLLLSKCLLANMSKHILLHQAHVAPLERRHLKTHQGFNTLQKIRFCCKGVMHRVVIQPKRAALAMKKMT